MFKWLSSALRVLGFVQDTSPNQSLQASLPRQPLLSWLPTKMHFYPLVTTPDVSLWWPARVRNRKALGRRLTLKASFTKRTLAGELSCSLIAGRGAAPHSGVVEGNAV